jgi:hypothetical protein
MNDETQVVDRPGSYDMTTCLANLGPVDQVNWATAEQSAECVRPEAPFFRVDGCWGWH